MIRGVSRTPRETPFSYEPPAIKTPQLTLGPPLDADAIYTIERTLSLEYHKWDTRLGGDLVLSRQPIIIPENEWNYLSDCAERLAAETLGFENEITLRPDLYRRLGIPGRLRRSLSRMNWSSNSPSVRAMRFDFHPTEQGWRVSEVNSDVPGGYCEATFLPRLFAQFYDYGRLPPPVLDLWGGAMQAAVPGGIIAIISAPGYTEDHQVVRTLMRELTRRQVDCRWIQSPAALEWQNREPRLAFGSRFAVSAIVRFYQAEWLAELPRRTNWENLLPFRGASNPVISVFPESKRFPLLWPELSGCFEVWRSVLPECCDPQLIGDLDRDGWVLKAAYSNTGDSVIIGSTVSAPVWRRALRVARRRSSEWVAQRRFDTMSLDSVDGRVYPCIGLYVINGKAAGAYVRLSRYQLTDGLALEAPLFIAPDGEVCE